MDGGGTLLRVVALGAVDDGKSTLLGRLAADLGQITEEERAAIAAPLPVGIPAGAPGGALGGAPGGVHAPRPVGPDHALLLDGLAAEREQGITIDVAYRSLAVAGRRVLLADAPGHEGYLRNAVTAASLADLGILLVDASRGLRPQTRRHALVLSLLRVPRVVLAVGKMDLVGHDRDRFEAIAAGFAAHAARLGLDAVQALPVVATTGGNLVRRDPAMPWYAGPTLVECLAAAPAAETAGQAFRMPVQWVARTGVAREAAVGGPAAGTAAAAGFRGLAGPVAAGTARPGDALRIVPGDRAATVARLVSPDGDLPVIRAGEAAMVVLAEEVDCGRGDVLCAASAPLESADRFEAALIWFGDAPLRPGHSCRLQLATTLVGARVTEVGHRLDVESGPTEDGPAETERMPAASGPSSPGMATGSPAANGTAAELPANGIGVCRLLTDRPIAFAPYAESREFGGFVLVDRRSNATLGAGMIRRPLRGAENLHWQTPRVDRAARAARLGQRPRVLWFTGLSGAGKSTIANLVEARLHAEGRHTYLLDGDNIRHGLNRDLGFAAADRAENIRRLSEVARLMADAGLVVLVAAISPFRADRLAARERIGAADFLEVFVDVPLEVAEARDPKGLYRRARGGQIGDLTGIGSPYEPPQAPELHLDATRPAEESAELVLRLLARD
ncbi:adenylyl-sulfate kinase [Roseomonas sp. NAR14]|uniref:Adenylyl-sulfate kinase n=1 Tax=Roseomonas acroporae TaxID=2937791 RepID=A0A9X2BTJ9_9PROT|nr:adenylyl-sulfate kinase [Roseomonas acroporae]MCK8784678.1 adenylyl-sulfate kinase [Roseomonas acroporae]